MPSGGSADRGDCQSMTRPLWTYTAAELVAGFASGRFTPDDALASVLDRCTALNPTLNAVIALNPDARVQAAASTDRWRSRAPASPLDGVPITLKDNLLVAGMPATWGSRAFADFRPRRDELPVAQLRQAGLVFVGKTNVPELTLQGYTDNLLFGPTGNPWAPDLTPGGSSGGAAAAVAGGIGPLALCTDGGGSTRRPAGHTGVFGFKPSTQTIARGGGFPAILGDFEVVGLLARSLEDIGLAFDILAPTRRDPLPSTPPRALYVRTFADQPVDPEVTASVSLAVAELAVAGWRIEYCDSLDVLAPVEALWPIVAQSGVAYLFECRPELRDGAGSDIVAMAKAGATYTGRDYAGALADIAELRAAFAASMAKYDVLVTPAIAALSWPKSETHPKTIDGKPVGPRGHALFTAFANALGLPALAVPTGVSRAGLPIGLQLVGRSGTDRRLLELARGLSGSCLVSWSTSRRP